MIDFSFSEVLFTLLIAVLVLKPEDVPKAVRTVKGWVGQARGLFNEVKAALDASLAETGLAEDVKYIRDETGKLHRVYDISDFVDSTRPPLPSSPPASGENAGQILPPATPQEEPRNDV